MASSLEVVLKLRDNMTGGFKKAEGTVQRFTKNTKSAFKSLFNIPNLIAGTAAVAVAKTFYSATTALEAMESRMKSAVVTSENFNDSMAFTRDISRRLGLDIKATTNGFAGFAASALRGNLTIAQTKQIFEDVSTAATSLKLSKERLGLVFSALEQMAGKGRVSMEELRQQLGDSLPGAVSIAARSMNMTTAAFIDAVSKGRVMSDEFLPRFGAQLRKELGGASEEAANSLQANMTRVSNAIFRINSSLGSILSGDASQGLGALEKTLTGIADGIERNAGKIRAGVLTVVLPLKILLSALNMLAVNGVAFVRVFIDFAVLAFETVRKPIDLVSDSLLNVGKLLHAVLTGDVEGIKSAVTDAFTDTKNNIDSIKDSYSEAFRNMKTNVKTWAELQNEELTNIGNSMYQLSEAYKNADKTIDQLKNKASSGVGGGGDPFGATGAGATENFSGISMTTGLGFQAKINAQNELMKQSKMRYLEEIGQLEQLSVEASIKRANMMRDAYQNIATSLQTAFADAFTIMVDLNTSAAEKIRGVMRSMFRYITQMLIQYLAKMAALRFAQFLLTGGTGGGALIGSGLINLFAGNKGYATGTNNAQPGWHLVGENGPELMRFRGGEQVRNNYQSRNMGQAGPISINTTIQGNADSNTVRAINDSNEKLARQIEDLVRKRYLPAGAFGL